MDSRNERNIPEKIDLDKYARSFLQELWAIILFAIAVSLLAGTIRIVSYRPEYTTKSTFVVTVKNMKGSMQMNLVNAQDTALRFSQIIDSSLLKKTVAEDLGVKEFPARTSVNIVEETNLMDLSVTASTPTMAYRTIRSILNNYNEVSDYVIENVVLEIIQNPQMPTEESNPLKSGTRKTMAKAFALAFILAVIYVEIFSSMRDTVRSENDMKNKVAARHLGTIYHDKQGDKGSKNKNGPLLINNPMLSFRFAESSKMTASRIKSHMDRHGAKVLMVTSVAEHEGKSTVSANIALALAQEGHRTLLIDCDFRKPTQYKVFGVDEEQTVDFPKVLETYSGLQRVIHQYKKTGMYFIFNRVSTFTAESFIGNGVFDYILNFCRKRLDYIILDMAPMALVSDTEDLANAADASVLVVRYDMMMAKDINDTIDILNNTKSRLLGCVLNDAPGGSGEVITNYGGQNGKRSKRRKLIRNH